jgi:hypothetical protein
MAVHSACVTPETCLLGAPGDAIVQQPLENAAAVFAKMAAATLALDDRAVATRLVRERFAVLAVLCGFFIAGSNILRVINRRANLPDFRSQTFHLLFICPSIN